MTSGSATAARPLRADAARNHHAIVAAAREAFETDGPDVSLGEVARRAGVGSSTLYRRFAGRDDLVAAVLEQYVAERLEPALAAAADVADPWEALVTALEGMVGSVAGYRVVLRAAHIAGATLPEAATRVLEPLAAILRRGQDAGVVRADVVPEDLPTIVHMAVVTTGPWDGANDPRRWPRYLALLVDGLRPAPGSLPRRVPTSTGAP